MATWGGHSRIDEHLGHPPNNFTNTERTIGKTTVIQAEKEKAGKKKSSLPKSRVAIMREFQQSLLLWMLAGASIYIYIH
jgi:hypothetical protein